jgi:hypothetical protein
MDSGVGAACADRPPRTPRQTLQRSLDFTLNRTTLGLPLPAAEARAIELENKQKSAFHQATETSPIEGGRQPA